MKKDRDRAERAEEGEAHWRGIAERQGREIVALEEKLADAEQKAQGAAADAADADAAAAQADARVERAEAEAQREKARADLLAHGAEEQAEALLDLIDRSKKPN